MKSVHNLLGSSREEPGLGGTWEDSERLWQQGGTPEAKAGGSEGLEGLMGERG